MLLITVAREVSQPEISWLKDGALCTYELIYRMLNMPPKSVTRATDHFEMSALKAYACANISCILVTLFTCHLEMSPLKCFAM